jgi:ATP-dependent Zn protease
MVGLEKKGGWGEASRMKEIVAYHEAGHAIAGALIPVSACATSVCCRPHRWWPLVSCLARG